MDDVVFRLLRELPDTDKDRYDIAYERGRAQVRSSLLFGGMALGLVAGGLGLFLLDPVVGAGRRAQLAQRAKAVAERPAADDQGPEPRPAQPHAGYRDGARPAGYASEQPRAAGDSAHHVRRVEVRGQDAATERRGERRAPRGRHGSGAGGCRHRGALTRRVRRPRPARAGFARRGAGVPGSGRGMRR